jgi:hypothetical protein
MPAVNHGSYFAASIVSARALEQHEEAHPIPSIGVMSRPLSTVVIVFDRAQPDSGDAKHLEIVISDRTSQRESQRTPIMMPYGNSASKGIPMVNNTRGRTRAGLTVRESRFATS